MVSNSKKAQAAMEFLMTYGWAIIAVLISIAALAYFGVITAGFVPESCTLFSGVACVDFYANKAEIVMTINNGGGETFSTFEVSINGCSGSASNGLADREKETLVLQGCNLQNLKSLKSTIDIAYTSDGVFHSRIGSISVGVANNYKCFAVCNNGFEIDAGNNYGSGDSTAGNNLADGWIDSASATGISSLQRYSGSYSQRFSTSTNEAVNPPTTWFRQTSIPVSPSTNYRITFASMKTSLGGKLSMRVDLYDASNVFIATSVPQTTDATSASPTWGLLSRTFTTPSNAGYINVYFFNSLILGCPCELYLDDVNLERV